MVAVGLSLPWGLWGLPPGEQRALLGRIADAGIDHRLRTEVAANGQRLTRIEGFLGIGMPDAAGRATRALELGSP